MNIEKIRAKTYEIFTDKLLLISAALILTLSFFGFFPTIKASQIVPIFLLWVLFVAVKALEESKFLNYLALRLDSKEFVPQKMILIAFLFSLILSIDVTLIILLPLTLLLKVKNRVTLFILVAFTTHLGAALTPFGTPQNLFIFSYYHISILEFIKIMAPFSFGMLILFFALSFLVKEPKKSALPKIEYDSYKAIFSISILIFAIIVSMHILPWYFGFIVLLLAFYIEKRALDVDYALLFTFTLFIILSNQFKALLSPYFSEIKEPFFITIILSQFISNVAATLFLHNFTSNYAALLLGSNVGSFGTPIAALANLITYKIYIAKEGKKSNFLYTLTLWGFGVLGVGILLIIYLQNDIIT